MNTREKILAFIKYIGVSPSEFERYCNLGNGLISKIGEKINRSTLNKILAVYPELNRAWIEDDEEPMIKKMSNEYPLQDKLSEAADSRIKTYGCPDCIVKQKEIETLHYTIETQKKLINEYEIQLGKKAGTHCG